MDFDFHTEIPGKVATRIVGCVEVVIEIFLAAWFIRDISSASYSTDDVELVALNSIWLSTSRNSKLETLIGVYFGAALLFSVALIYSTFPVIHNCQKYKLKNRLIFYISIKIFILF